MRYSKNEAEIKDYVDKHEEYFAKLKKDVKNNGLEKGVSKNDILIRYGEPILWGSPECGKNINVSECCLYRMPTRFFHTDKVYLYFDDKDNLSSWEFKPAS
ncbi:MAG: hypothetical protein PHN57_02605 [Candidatus Omnitrophica bacterium]|nr:hypothetical protein [Candidatus Omnitrophota bacterium]